MKKEDVISLAVRDNAGVAFLETAGEHLFCVFQDGQVAGWDWASLPDQKIAFAAGTDRICILDQERFIAVTKTGDKILSVNQLMSGKKLKQMAVGEASQQVWPRISFDKTVIALVRKTMANASGEMMYEFATVDLERDLLGLPVRLRAKEGKDVLIDYAVGADHVLYAVGSRENKGWITAVNLKKGTILWNQVYEDLPEFCSVQVFPDDQFIIAGNREGLLCKIGSQAAEVSQTVQLLQEGEQRLVTNDYSALNIAFSQDGTYFAATINPKVYIIQTADLKVIHRGAAGHKLTSKVTFSPDNRYFVTSDIRASGTVKVHKISETN